MRSIYPPCLLLLAIPCSAVAQRPGAYEINVGGSMPSGSFGTDTARTGIGAEGLAEFFKSPVRLYVALSMNRFPADRGFGSDYVLAGRGEIGLRYRKQMRAGFAVVGVGPLYGALLTNLPHGFGEEEFAARAFGMGAHAGVGLRAGRHFDMQLKARYARYSPQRTHNWSTFASSGSWNVSTVAYTAIEIGARYDGGRN
jgi:hypothetical protein